MNNEKKLVILDDKDYRSNTYKGNLSGGIDKEHFVIRVSQIKNLGLYSGCIFGLISLDLVVWYFNEYLQGYYSIYHGIGLHMAVFLFCLYLYFEVRCEYYKITLNNIVCYKGVFNRDINNIEMYRIKDYAIQEPLHYRVFGISNLTIVSSDRLRPILRIEGIRRASNILNDIRVLVENERIRLGVREID